MLQRHVKSEQTVAIQFLHLPVGTHIRTASHFFHRPAPQKRSGMMSVEKCMSVQTCLGTLASYRLAKRKYIL